MLRDVSENNSGANFKPEVQNTIKLTLTFAKAAAKTQQEGNGNLVVSPYNALTCMAMVAKGADNKTKAELAQTLFGVDAEDLDTEIEKLSALNAEILGANEGRVELKTANGIWSNQDLLALDEDFARKLKEFFDAEISGEDFSDPAVVDKINAWAAENTNDLITDIVKDLSPDDFAVLASALYFKGEWTNKFDKSQTKDSMFTSDDQSMAWTRMMYQDFQKEGDMTFLKGDGYTAVALTYGEKGWNTLGEDTVEEWCDPTMRMIMMLPEDGNVSAVDFLAGQDGQSVPAWADPSSYERVVGSITLPHMDIKQKHDLIPVLQEMGVQSAFNSGADFSLMSKERNKDLYLSQVSHDVVFKTDEEGSEAAAVTTAIVSLRSVAHMPKRIDIQFNRSYVFALQDIKTGTVLFIGAVNHPNNAMKPFRSPRSPKPMKPLD